VAALGITTPAYAQFAKPEDAYKYRTGVMTLQNAHMGRISAQLRSPSPNLQVIAENAILVDTFNKLFYTAFPDGSDTIANSRAKPELWKNRAKFKEYADRLNGDVAKLVAASKSGDMDGTRSAFQATAAACKACHDDFRRD
jgi:cytochrome c556